MSDLEPPKHGAVDRILDLSLAVVGDLPLIGGTVAEVMRQLFGTPLERRRDASLAMLASAVTELQTRQANLDELADREQWVTVALEAVRIGYGEHLEAKLAMLKAIIVNAGLYETDRAADMLTMRYLPWVDELEPEHIVVLKWLADRESPETAAAFTALPREFVPLASADLDARRLIVGTVTREERMPIIPKPNPGPRDPITGGHVVRGRHEVGSVKGDLSNATIVPAGRRFLDWLTIV